MNPSYKLTKHPLGSLREIWSISWPLIAAILSQSLMLVVDRFIVSRYSLEAMNAVATSGMWVFTLVVIPFAIAEMTEVFVGRLHGANDYKKIGSTTWQMLWFVLLLFPIYFLLSRYTDFIYAGSINAELEALYTSILMLFCPFHVACIALSGFFVGIGKTKYITFALILANFCNLALDILLVFGYVGFPEMGLRGAAIATGIASIIQFGYMLFLFLRKEYRDMYETGKISLEIDTLKQSMRTALPQGIARFVELLSHCTFYRIVLSYGNEVMAQVTVVQSIYLISCIFGDGISKGATAIISNLIGAGREEHIKSVIASAIRLLVVAVLFLGSAIISCRQEIISLFFHEYYGSDVIASQALLSNMKYMFFLMSLFLLFDGTAWILIGYFAARTKTAFILKTSIFMHWCIYIPMIYFAMKLSDGNPVMAWFTIAVYGALAALFYFISFLRNERKGNERKAAQHGIGVQEKAT